MEGPQSDDSSSTDSEEEEEHGPSKRDRNKEDTLAYLVGPRRDGKILNKDGTIIDVNESFVITIPRRSALPPNGLPASTEATIRPTWTRQLIAFQLSQLKKGHKMGRHKIALKIMRQIRRTVQRIEEHDIDKGLEKGTSQSSKNRRFQTQLALPQFDAALGFLNPPNSPVLLHQCMNALTSSRPSKSKGEQVKTSPPNNLPKRPRNSFLPLAIPGTPDAPIQANPTLQPTLSSSTERCSEYTPNDNDTDDELTYLDLYYQVFNKHRPEPGESNADATSPSRTNINN